MRRLGLRLAFALQDLAMRIDLIGWHLEGRLTNTTPCDEPGRPDWWRTEIAGSHTEVPGDE